MIDDGGSAEKDAKDKLTQAYTGAGKLINSGEQSHKDSESAKNAIIEQLAADKRGKASVNFKLRDWLFSRQRYWGEPFPVIWLKECDYAQVDDSLKSVERPVTCEVDGELLYAIVLPESELPLELPAVESYTPSPDGQSPLSKAATTHRAMKQIGSCADERL